METRQIVIIETKNQRKSVINSSAETLAELKADLNAAGIDYTNMTFYEGTSKTELKTNDSILPKDVPYKGTITNNLVFMLTNINKKIESGMMSRTELYADIKKMGLQEECKKRYGKNFTQCKTDELKHLIDSVKIKESGSQVIESKVSENRTVENNNTVNNTDTACKCIDVELRKAFSVLLSVLDEECVISSENIDVIKGYINTDSVVKEVNKEEENVNTPLPYSQEEIDEMFNKMF